MTTIIEITVAAALILSIIVPWGAFLLGEKNRKRYKRSLAANCFFFFGTLVVASVAMLAGARRYRLLTRRQAADWHRPWLSGRGSRNRDFRHRLRYRRCQLCQRGSGRHQRRWFPVR